MNTRGILPAVYQVLHPLSYPGRGIHDLWMGGGSWPGQDTPPPRPCWGTPPRVWTDWKHYLSHPSGAGGKYQYKNQYVTVKRNAARDGENQRNVKEQISLLICLALSICVLAKWSLKPVHVYVSNFHNWSELQTSFTHVLSCVYKVWAHLEGINELFQRILSQSKSN